MKNDGTVYYFPAPRSFQDTGFVTHGFNDGSSVSARVVPSKDVKGYAIELIVKDGEGKEVCNFTMDRFAALCLVDCLNKNLLNQEELTENEYNYKNQLTFSRRRECGGPNQEGSTMGP